MPRKVTAWACEFKCGFKIYTNKQTIVNHEDGCFSNPAKRACKTCKNLWSEQHEELSPDGYNMGYKSSVGCLADYLDNPYKKNPDGLRFDCPKWEAE